MADHVWTVFCRRVLIDQPSNSLSLMDVIEGIKISQSSGGSPVQSSTDINITGMDLVTLWTRSDANTPEEIQTKVILQSPDGKKHPQPEQTIDLKSRPRNRHILRMTGLPFTVEGRYYWTVQQKQVTKSGQQKWKSVARVPFDWVVVTEPEIVQSEPSKSKPRKKAKSKAKGKVKRKRKA